MEVSVPTFTAMMITAGRTVSFDNESGPMTTADAKTTAAFETSQLYVPKLVTTLCGEKPRALTMPAPAIAKKTEQEDHSVPTPVIN